MRRSEDRILTTHVGSLIRPEALLGFAQAQDMQRVHPQVMWAKLEALAEGARLASQDLWGR